jgi:hypothetical protein
MHPQMCFRPPVGEPPVSRTDAGDQVQPHPPVGSVAADSRGGQLIDGRVADVQQPEAVGGGHLDPDRGVAMPQPVGGQLLEREQQPFHGPLLGHRRAAPTVQGAGQLQPVGCQVGFRDRLPPPQHPRAGANRRPCSDGPDLLVHAASIRRPGRLTDDG